MEPNVPCRILLGYVSGQSAQEQKQRKPKKVRAEVSVRLGLCRRGRPGQAAGSSSLGTRSRTSLLQGAGSTAPVVPLFPRVHFSAADGRCTKDLPSVLGSQRTLGYSSAWKNPPIPSHPNASHDNTSYPNTSHPNSTQLIPSQHIAPHPTPSKAVALPACPVSGLQGKVAQGKFFGHPSRKGREVPRLLRVNCPTSASPHAGDLGVQGLPVPPSPLPRLPWENENWGPAGTGCPGAPRPSGHHHDVLSAGQSPKQTCFPESRLQSSCPDPLVHLPGWGRNAWSQRHCSAFLLRREDGEPERFPHPASQKHLSEQRCKANFHTTHPRVLAGMAGPRHGPWPWAGGQCCLQEPWQPSPSPRDSVSGCRGRNALGSREDKIKSLWGVTRQHSRKKDSTVCFLGGLFGFFYFILLYFWQL